MNRRFRVLYLEPSAQLSGGGIALLRLVRAIDRKRYVPIVLLGSDGPLVDEFRAVPGCRVLIRPLPAGLAGVTRSGVFTGGLRHWWQAFRYVRQLRSIGRRMRPDITHSNGQKMHLMAAAMIPSERGELIWHMRDLVSPPYMPKRTAALVRFLSQRLPKRVICNSEATMRTIAPSAGAVVIHGGIERPAHARAQSVHDGVDYSPLRSQPSQPRALRVAILGRIAQWKGQAVFIDAALRLIPRFPDVTFLVAGAATTAADRCYLRELELKVQSAGVGGRLVMMGLVRDVPSFLDSLSILVHCSLSPEPFGQVIVEGMAAGLPVVASCAGGPAEIITDGQTGFLYPPGDVERLVAILERLLDEPEGRQRIGLSAMEEVGRRFTIDRTARKIEDIYGGVLPPTGSPRPRRHARYAKGINAERSSFLAF